MRILWHGVSGDFKTGYANQTKLFTPALKEAGHEVAVNSMIAQYNTGLDSRGIVNYATGPRQELMGNHMLLSHAAEFKPDIAISMCDPFVCSADNFGQLNWFPFVMVDCEPYSWENVSTLRAARQAISPTRNAQEILARQGFDTYYVPLAIDCDVFKPGDREKARAELGKAIGCDLSDKYVVMMNSANHSSPSRKNFAAAFKAFAEFEKKHKEAILYCHTEITGTMYPGGEDLQRVRSLYGTENVYFAPQYDYWSCRIPESFMASAYNAADVFLHTARGEGFGLPLIEAQACGCPVIVPQFGAMLENCFDGYTCGGRRFMYHAGAEQFLVDENQVYEGLVYMHDFYGRERDPDGVKRAVAGASKFDIANVMEAYMLPVLEDIQEQLTKEMRDNEKREMAGKADVPAPVTASA